jgi:phosphohistidine phosphatase SixA
MSLSAQALSAHRLIDTILAFSPGERAQTIEQLQEHFNHPDQECRLDHLIKRLWNVAVHERGVYDEDRARILIDRIIHLCG